ncbi:hypothetical protein B0T25DRAFT_53098 [Lasiosphaeria hispida]|uniref:Uncharacterized protein n=1 Tax=Lasiosphaeria hispida TaxID=260671 RepID=A0AAJ0HVS2_9PEZI|nr:hypothetical protein B0T25DRAFT_53098 [Lasiosphaeria hispida]
MSIWPSPTVIIDPYADVGLSQDIFGLRSRRRKVAVGKRSSCLGGHKYTWDGERGCCCNDRAVQDRHSRRRKTCRISSSRKNETGEAGGAATRNRTLEISNSPASLESEDVASDRRRRARLRRWSSPESGDGYGLRAMVSKLEKGELLTAWFGEKLNGRPDIYGACVHDCKFIPRVECNDMDSAQMAANIGNATVLWLFFGVQKKGVARQIT